MKEEKPLINAYPPACNCAECDGEQTYAHKEWCSGHVLHRSRRQQTMAAIAAILMAANPERTVQDAMDLAEDLMTEAGMRDEFVH